MSSESVGQIERCLLSHNKETDNEQRKPSYSFGRFFMKDLQESTFNHWLETHNMKKDNFKELYLRGTVMNIKKGEHSDILSISDGTGAINLILDLSKFTKEYHDAKLRLDSLQERWRKINQDCIILEASRKILKKQFLVLNLKVGDVIECFGKYWFMNGELWYKPNKVQVNNEHIERKNKEYMMKVEQCYTFYGKNL